ncbi:hypothetical protein [Paractinoplanes globisporus]|uniref:Uncharacterized protein n=1 Tax=Paractinoplanes globisporus TaxID=113565 RepID=A0ABW6WC01_9ACTN|nr:hypothetical protein [Actinoplanes globisporus]
MAETTEIPVRLSIPSGYAELPLDDIASTVDVTRRLVDELGTPAQRQAGEFVFSSLYVFLSALAERNALYCGIGRHLSALNGQLITSSLVVTLMDFPGSRNPRLVLRDVLVGKARAHEAGQADIVDLPDGPVAFFEHTLLLPNPAIPGQHTLAAGAEVPVWQLEAFVPSSDGSRLIAIELSTPFAEHGPQYRAMVVAMAGGIDFDPPAEDDPLAALLG